MQKNKDIVSVATNRPGSVDLTIFRNLLNAEYQGVLYSVNPKSILFTESGFFEESFQVFKQY